MKEGWTIRTIGEVALHLCDGSHNPPVGIDFSEYLMLSSKNIFFDSYDYSEPRYLTKEQFDIENKRTNVSDGDILLTIVGTIGRVCCIKEPFQPFTLQRSVAVIKPNKNIIISRYLMYCLCGLNAYFNKEAKGVAQKGIYLKQLSKISIPVPPLQEQERIVTELDLLTGIIDKQKQQLKELDTLAQSIFYDMFGNPQTDERGWNMEKLSSICVSISDGSHNPPKGGKKSDYLMLSSKNIKDGVLSLEEPRYLSKDEFSLENKRTNVKKGDILLTIVGTIGRCCLFDSSKNIVFQRSVAILKPNDTTNNLFLMYQMIMLRMVFENEAKGVAQKGIYLRQLGNIMVIVPPKGLQDSFAQKIQAIESQKQSINRSIAESQKLFDYTMDKYFG